VLKQRGIRRGGMKGGTEGQRRGEHWWAFHVCLRSSFPLVPGSRCTVIVQRNKSVYPKGKIHFCIPSLEIFPDISVFHIEDELTKNQKPFELKNEERDLLLKLPTKSRGEKRPVPEGSPRRVVCSDGPEGPHHPKPEPQGDPVGGAGRRGVGPGRL